MTKQKIALKPKKALNVEWDDRSMGVGYEVINFSDQN